MLYGQKVFIIIAIFIIVVITITVTVIIVINSVVIIIAIFSSIFKCDPLSGNSLREQGPSINRRSLRFFSQF